MFTSALAPAYFATQKINLQDNLLRSIVIIHIIAMELKNAESKVNELRLLYESIRLRSAALGGVLPSLEIQPNQSGSEFVIPSKGGTTSGSGANEILLDLDLVRNGVDALQSKIEKFEKRKNEKDPVTQQPRYGQNTITRVETILNAYADLRSAVLKLLGDASDDPDTVVVPIEVIRKRAEEEDKEKEQQEQEARKARELEDEAKRFEEARKAEELRIAEESRRLEEERQRVETARLLEEARLTRMRQQQEAERADRAWIDSIEKGPNGVRKQLNILIESTDGDPSARSVAINALHTLFSQIVSRPEENNFRRIRRDHPKFLQGKRL